MQSKFRLLLLILLSGHFAFSQDTQTLDHYIHLGHDNNPVIKENNALKQYYLFQNDLTFAQFNKPQLNFTSDYLFAPYFFNKGRIISITQNPEKNAFGYDFNLSNGGLYAAQLNATLPLLTNGIIKSYSDQIAIQIQLLQNNNKQLIHELDKSISDQYISVYQLQEQINYQLKLISLVEDRNKIVAALVQKGLMQQNDYLLLEIEIKQRQYDVQQLKVNLSAAFNRLNNICGLSDTLLYELHAPEIILKPNVQHYFFRQKYELDSTNIMSQQAIFNTKYRPQLSAFGNTGINAVDASNIPHNIGISAGLHLSIPIYDGGQKKTVEQQNKILIDNLQLYQNQKIIQLENNLNSLQQQINLNQQSITLINSQLESQEILLQIIKDKVVTGQISVTDYLNALQNYAIANQNKILTQSNLWLLINQYNYINW